MNRVATALHFRAGRLGRLALAWVLILAVAPAGWAQVRTDLYRGHLVVAGEVLVKFRAGATAVAPLLAAHLSDADPARAVGGDRLYRLRSRSKDVAALIGDLSSHPDVAFVEPNYLLHTARAGVVGPSPVDPVGFAGLPTDDPMFGSLWGLQNTGQAINGIVGVPGADIGAVPAWGLTTGSRANVVAVIDAGIDYHHPDLAANVWSAPAAFTVDVGGVGITCPAGSHGFNAITGSCDPMDDGIHGTHVAGTIGAIGNNATGVSGVNWTASIMALKFLDADGSGTIADAIGAIEFAIGVKATFAETAGANVRVLSASWGGSGFSQALLEAIHRANANGILFVTVAGNGGSDNDTTPFYPANFDAPNVITVAATTNRDGLAGFSNYGAHTVHLGAPGVDILSTSRNGEYQSLSGTSMAAPHVSGAAALILSRCGLDIASLRNTLLENVVAVAALGSRTLTGGRLDVGRAVSACANLASPDFTLAMSPASGRVTIGGRTTYTVTVNPSDGFAGAVSLAVSRLPAGATGSFDPSSVDGSGSSTLTIVTEASLHAGTHPVTVTGTSGSLSHAASATLLVLTRRAGATISKTAGAASDPPQDGPPAAE